MGLFKLIGSTVVAGALLGGGFVSGYFAGYSRGYDQGRVEERIELQGEDVVGRDHNSGRRDLQNNDNSIDGRVADEESAELSRSYIDDQYLSRFDCGYEERVV